MPHNSFDSVRRVCVIYINCGKDDFDNKWKIFWRNDYDHNE